jgi:hypothetical protein
MSVHHLCRVNCGGTACEAMEQAKTEHVRGMHDSAYRQSVILLKNSPMDRFILLAERGWSRLCARVSAASSLFRRSA